MAHILIVDDNSELRSTTRKMLESAGHQVSEAANGVEGLDRITASVKSKTKLDEIQVALVDLIMPEKDGLMLIQEALAQSPRLKIIAISGGPQGNPAWLPIAKSAGATRMLKKPFTKDQLLRHVQELLADNWK